MPVYQGLCPPPCSCHLPSGLPRLPPSRPTPTFPSSLHNSSNSPAFPHPPFPGWIQSPGAGEGSTLPYFQESFQTYMPGRLPAIGCLAILFLTPAWSLLYPASTQLWWSDFSRLEVAENLIKSHQLLPTDYFPLQFLLLF